MKFEVPNQFLWVPFHGLPRLTLMTVLNLGPRAVTLWAPVCSSWGIPCRGTSMRSEINPCGYEGYNFVASANLMVARNLGMKSCSTRHDRFFCCHPESHHIDRNRLIGVRLIIFDQKTE